VTFVFVLTAGLTVGLIFDLFVLSVFCVPLFVAAFIALAPGGIVSAFLTASEIAAILQLGYVAGLLLRGGLGPRAPILAAEKPQRREP
jgi:hypothetical protein